MTSKVAERRKKERRTPVGPKVVRLELDAQYGNSRWITADLIDVSSGGIGIVVLKPLTVGSRLVVRGNLGDSSPDSAVSAIVRWCTEQLNGSYHAGLEYEAGGSARQGGATSAAVPAGEDEDYYETMQLSPNADSETIQRVYRVLAQRYHPDSLHTGNTEMFRRLCDAYRVLSDPGLRAQYDVRHSENRRLQWKIFDQAKTTLGPEGEQRKRRGILELLYAKAIHDPERATMTIFEFEQLLGCPREHLETALWYLRGKGFVKRGDSGRVTITIEGFDEVERLEAPREQRSAPLLESGIVQHV